MVNILNLAEVQEQKQIDEITKCIVDSLINEENEDEPDEQTDS